MQREVMNVSPERKSGRNMHPRKIFIPLKRMHFHIVLPSSCVQLCTDLYIIHTYAYSIRGIITSCRIQQIAHTTQRQHAGDNRTHPPPAGLLHLVPRRERGGQLVLCIQRVTVRSSTHRPGTLLSLRNKIPGVRRTQDAPAGNGCTRLNRGKYKQHRMVIESEGAQVHV